MRAHLAKHKAKYGFVAAIGLASFSYNAFVTPTPAPNTGIKNPAVSQRQADADKRVAEGTKRCNEWITPDSRIEAFGEGVNDVLGSHFATSGTESLDCVFRASPTSTSFSLNRLTLSSPERAQAYADAVMNASSTNQKRELIVQGSNILTLRIAPPTTTTDTLQVLRRLIEVTD